MNRLDPQQSDVHGDAASDQAEPVSISSELKEESTFGSREPLVIFPAAAGPGGRLDSPETASPSGLLLDAPARPINDPSPSSSARRLDTNIRSAPARRDATPALSTGARARASCGGGALGTMPLQESPNKSVLVVVLMLLLVLLLLCFVRGRQVTDRGSGGPGGFQVLQSRWEASEAMMPTHRRVRELEPKAEISREHAAETQVSG